MIVCILVRNIGRCFYNMGDVDRLVSLVDGHLIEVVSVD